MTHACLLIYLLLEYFVKTTELFVALNITDKEVSVRPYITDIEDIDISGSISYKLYFRVHWRDSRIRVREDLVNTTKWHPLDLEVKKYIWTPDLYIYWAEKIFKAEILASESMNVKKQEFYNTFELKATTKCKVNLGKFPHDEQKCILEIGSFLYLPLPESVLEKEELGQESFNWLNHSK